LPPSLLKTVKGFIVCSTRKERKVGSDSVSSDYPGYEEYGTSVNQGQCTDLDLVHDNIEEGASVMQQFELYPGTVSSAYRVLNDYKELCLDQACKADVLAEDYGDVKWKPFQQDILDLIDTKSDQRTIHWYHEPTGKVGKTKLTRYLACMNLAYTPDATKAADIFCGYNREPVVIFDIPRSKIDHMDHLYGVCEKFIDGDIFVGKYKSKAMPINPPHVIVFSNDVPKLEITNKDTGTSHDTMSRDRWHIVHIPESYLKSHDNTIVPRKPASKTKPTESWEEIMKIKDANPAATTQAKLNPNSKEFVPVNTDNAPASVFEYEKPSL